MFNKLQKLSEFFTKKKRRALNSREDFSIEDENDTPDGLSIFLTVLVIVSLTFDILKHTQVYENNVMKHILNTNYVLSYGIGSLIKMMCMVLSIITLFVSNDEWKKYPGYENNTESQIIFTKITTGIIIIILLTSLIFDIIIFTPLMQNKYINSIASFNSSITLGVSLITKILFLLNPTENPIVSFFLLGEGFIRDTG